MCLIVGVCVVAFVFPLSICFTLVYLCVVVRFERPVLVCEKDETDRYVYSVAVVTLA
jgi:hypothetical protein